MNYMYESQQMREKTFEFIYGCAMRDAILQKAYKGEKAWISQVYKPKQILSEYICKILSNEFSSQKEHDEFFLETANKICFEINKRESKTDVFSFGNAQKLINITAKHIYTFCYHNPSLREGFRFCHCPVDAIMLKKVWNLCKEKIDLGKRTEFCKSWGCEGVFERTQPELKDFPNRYNLFQKAIRDLIEEGDLFPIEFDYIVWKS